MRLSSIERRLQRYRVIYLWKIVIGLVHNQGIYWNVSPTVGVLINVPLKKCSPPSTQKYWDQSLGVHGGKLFNMLPANLRNFAEPDIEGFKCELDKFLEIIPDCPCTQYLHPAPISPITGKNSNCLLDWIPYLKINNRRSS